MQFGEELISSYTSASQSVIKGSQGKNWRQKPGGRDRGGVLLTSLPFMACSVYFLTYLRATYSGAVLPTSHINQDNALQVCLHASHTLIKIPFS